MSVQPDPTNVPWHETTQHERNRLIFEEELDAFLPARILDFHTHVLNEGIIPEGETYSCGGHAMAKYDLDDLARDLAELYPGRQTQALCFGLPHPQYDQQRSDAYLAAHCDGQRFFPLRLFDPEQDTPELLQEALGSGQFLGIKPYPDYVRKANPATVEIHEMLPAWAMEIIDAQGAIVMLHIPRSGRLADPLNQRQIVELCRRYPRAKIVLAHIGRAYFLKNITGQLDALAALPNLYYDLAMVGHWEVMAYLFHRVPHDHILYATDLPIAVAPGKSVEINNQYTYITPVPWELSISDDHGKLTFTAFAYEELRAIKRAVQHLELDANFVEGIFHNNGMRLIEDPAG